MRELNFNSLCTQLVKEIGLLFSSKVGSLPSLGIVSFHEGGTGTFPEYPVVELQQGIPEAHW